VDTAQTEPTSADTGPYADASRAEQARVHVRIHGEISFEWERETPLRIVTLTPDAREAHLFSLGIETVVPVSDEFEQFRFAFDLVGGYDGAGSYEIGGSGNGSGAGSGLLSTAFVIYLRLIDPDLENPYMIDNYEFWRTYDQVAKPCTLEVTEDEASGTLSCPALEDDEGHAISLEATWELVDT
jgi:hypothetical protein